MIFADTTSARDCLIAVFAHNKILLPFPSGSKGQQMITNWGPAAFSDAEFSHRKKKWQETKNEETQAQ